MKYKKGDKIHNDWVDFNTDKGTMAPSMEESAKEIWRK